MISASRTTRIGRIGSPRRSGDPTKARVTPHEDAARTVAKAVNTWGRLDVLVNNAGAGAILPLAAATPERISQIFAVNVLGPILQAARALPYPSRCTTPFLGSIGRASAETGPRLPMGSMDSLPPSLPSATLLNGILEHPHAYLEVGAPERLSTAV